jgi:hypothetical protein
MDFLAEPVETLENGVELAVLKRSAFHEC